MKDSTGPLARISSLRRRSCPALRGRGRGQLAQFIGHGLAGAFLIIRETLAAGRADVAQLLASQTAAAKA